MSALTARRQEGPFCAESATMLAEGRRIGNKSLEHYKMKQLFDEQNHMQVSYSLYYNVFQYDLNLGFGHPATDI